ncbi:MAG: hypothetical protein ACQUHE_02870, partial [Bacteroidia bacterium]
AITVPTNLLNASMRTVTRSSLQNVSKDLIEPGTLLRINAAAENRYRVELPDGRSGYVPGRQLVQAKKPLRFVKVAPSQLDLFELPDSLSAVKTTLNRGDEVAILGNFGSFQFVELGDKLSGWIKK